MLIIDDKNNSIDLVTLLLTTTEASELRDSLESILKLKTGSSHAHVNDSDFRKEITICTYTKGQVLDEGFDEHIKKHILEEG
jgi:hypothetical protein